MFQLHEVFCDVRIYLLTSVIEQLSQAKEMVMGELSDPRI
jgi:hypothetical protein